jgi:hypothetical protein
MAGINTWLTKNIVPVYRQPKLRDLNLAIRHRDRYPFLILNVHVLDSQNLIFQMGGVVNDYIEENSGRVLLRKRNFSLVLQMESTLIWMISQR